MSIMKIWGLVSYRRTCQGSSPEVWMSMSRSGRYMGRSQTTTMTGLVDQGKKYMLYWWWRALRSLHTTVQWSDLPDTCKVPLQLQCRWTTGARAETRSGLETICQTVYFRSPTKLHRWVLDTQAFTVWEHGQAQRTTPTQWWAHALENKVRFTYTIPF